MGKRVISMKPDRCSTHNENWTMTVAIRRRLAKLVAVFHKWVWSARYGFDMGRQRKLYIIVFQVALRMVGLSLSNWELWVWVPHLELSRVNCCHWDDICALHFLFASSLFLKGMSNSVFYYRYIQNKLII